MVNENVKSLLEQDGVLRSYVDIRIALRSLSGRHSSSVIESMNEDCVQIVSNIIHEYLVVNL